MEQSSQQHVNNVAKRYQLLYDNEQKFTWFYFPSGVRFDPSDDELIVKYLLPKIKEESLPPHLMHEVNIYDHNPKDLAESYAPQGDKIWYFFTPRDKKYPNGKRPSRKADTGYWRVTGSKKSVIYEGKEIGHRNCLAFYEGGPSKGAKTPWIMHEFSVTGPSQARKRKREDANKNRLDDYVLCRIYKKQEKESSNNQAQEGPILQPEKESSNNQSEEERILQQEIEKELLRQEEDENAQVQEEVDRDQGGQEAENVQVQEEVDCDQGGQEEARPVAFDVMCAVPRNMSYNNNNNDIHNIPRITYTDNMSYNNHDDPSNIFGNIYINLEDMRPPPPAFITNLEPVRSYNKHTSHMSTTSNTNFDANERLQQFREFIKLGDQVDKNVITVMFDDLSKFTSCP